MLAALFTLLTAAVLTGVLGLFARWARAVQWIAILGAAVALVIALSAEGLDGGGTAGALVTWPDALGWLGAVPFTSDPASASLGAWAILLGGLCLFRETPDETGAPWRLASVLLATASLYAVAHTTHLLLFACELIFLVFAVWTYDAASTHLPAGKQIPALALGALLLLGAALLVGRTTGGDDNLATISLASLSVWPLLLVTFFCIAWLGMLPLTAWSGQGRPDSKLALVQAVGLGLPVLVLLLRLQSLISAQALAGMLPGGWTTFMVALSWLGGLSALAAGAGMIVWAGTERWTAMLTAHTLGLMLWALALDTPSGRYAALAIFVASGAGRMTLEFARTEHDGERPGWLAFAGGVARASLAAVPALGGFVGVWLLGTALAGAAQASLVLALAGMAILAACGSALHAAAGGTGGEAARGGMRYSGALALLGAIALIAGGSLPGLWLPRVATIAALAGGEPPVNSTWQGLQASPSLGVPVLLILAGALVLIVIAWLVGTGARAGVGDAAPLLPPALERLAMMRNAGAAAQASVTPLLENPPAPVWWLSLAWLEAGLQGALSLLARLVSRLGMLLARLEGRYYLPLALIVALLALLAITR